MSVSRPPRLAEALLRRLLPSDAHGRTIVGDLHEEHRELVARHGSLRADLWYWRETLVTGVGYARPGRSTLHHLGHDVRHALRSMVREPGFAAAAVLTLALGIGAGTAIFSVVDGVLLRPLPFDEPDRLVRVWATNEETGQAQRDLLYQDVEALRSGAPSLASVMGLSTVTSTLMGWAMEDPEDVLLARTTPGFFSTFRVDPVVGRAYNAGDASAGGVILISSGLWRGRFGADPDVVGTMVHLGTAGYQIIGVLPEGLEYPRDADMWTPLRPEQMGDDDREVVVVGRVADGVDPSVVNAEVNAVGARLASALPETHDGWGAWIQPLQITVVRDVRAALFALLGAVGLLLAIACVNTANLLLARAARRRHEVAVRTALGASRVRVVSRYMTESVILALAGGAAGILVGRWILASMLAVAPQIPRLDTVALDLRVVAVMGVVTGVAGVLFGVGPALHAASAPPESTLRDSGRATTLSGRRITLQSGLVATEIAMSTVLAVLAVLLFSTFRDAVSFDRGFEHDQLVAMNVEPLHPPADGDEARAYFGAIVENVRALPGVRDVALSSHEILEQRGLSLGVAVEGNPVVGDEPRPATVRIVSGGFFRTTGIPLLRGRSFAADGGPEDEMDVVVNRRFVDLLVDPAQDAIGLGVELSWARGRIVGVVGDVSPALGEPARPIVYLPFQRETVPGMWVTVRAVGEAAPLVPGIREAVHDVDRWVPLQRVDLLGESVESSVAPQRFNMLLVVSFAALALVLAAVGIYGVTALSVATRRSEIGIRRALGASDPLVAAEIVKRVAQLTGVGLAIGILVSSLGGRLLGSVVVGVEPTDPGVLVVVTALLGAVALLAAGIPVARAIGIEPTEALRAE